MKWLQIKRDRYWGGNEPTEDIISYTCKYLKNNDWLKTFFATLITAITKKIPQKQQEKISHWQSTNVPLICTCNTQCHRIIMCTCTRYYMHQYTRGHYIAYMWTLYSMRKGSCWELVPYHIQIDREATVLCWGKPKRGGREWVSRLRAGFCVQVLLSMPLNGFHENTIISEIPYINQLTHPF